MVVDQESVENQMRIANTVADGLCNCLLPSSWPLYNKYRIVEEAFADIRDAATSTTRFVIQSFQVVEPADSKMGCAHAIRMFLERLALEDDVSVGVMMNQGCLQLNVHVLSVNVMLERQITYEVH